MNTFAERLIELRENRNWKKKELAAKLHVSDSMISQYESGRCMPSYDVMLALSKLFYVSIEYLLCGESTIHTIPSKPFISHISQAEFLEKCNRLSPNHRIIINTLVDSLLAYNEHDRRQQS